MKIVCIIEARYSSSRLPGKVLLPAVGRPLLALMVERLLRARTIDEIVIATTDRPADDPIVDLASQIGVGCFRGSEEDVLARVLGAARAVRADVIVETTGDCPLHDPAIVDKVVSDFRIGGADFVSNILELDPQTTPRGTDVRVFRTDDLDEINRTSNDPADHEHVSLHFWEHPEVYRSRFVPTVLGVDVSGVRLTVDTKGDYELVRRIFEALYPSNPEFGLYDVLSLLRENPEWLALNEGVVQKGAR